MEKNKKREWTTEFLPFFLTEIFAVLSVAAAGMKKGLWPRFVADAAILVFLSVVVIWRIWLKLYRQDRLSYNNKDHPTRFWTALCVCLLMAVFSGFLPVEFWPVQAIFLLPELMGSFSLGIVSGTACLMIPHLIEYGLSKLILMVLLFSGVVVSLQFQRYQKEIAIYRPIAFSMIGHLASLFLGLGMTSDRDELIRRGLGVLCGGALLWGITYLFFGRILMQSKKKYDRLNDTEGELLTAFRENAKLDYLRCSHAVYFCEKIAVRMGWNEDAMKCAAHYYKWGSSLPKLLRREDFPTKAAKILMDYYDNEIADIPQVRMRETAALVCTDIVLSSMIYMLNRGTDLPRYEVIIDAIFERMRRKGAFDKCEITGRELYHIRELFKEETYYYDTLRGK